MARVLELFISYYKENINLYLTPLSFHKLIQLIMIIKSINHLYM